MEYGELLKRARDNLPDIISTRERFEIPKVIGHIQKNRTIISNFNQIGNTLHTDQAHFLKYLLKELATSGDVRGNMLVFNRKLSSSEINQKIRQYANQFILCYECGKPDTKILVEGNMSFIKCQACGAKHHIKA